MGSRDVYNFIVLFVIGIHLSLCQMLAACTSNAVQQYDAGHFRTSVNGVNVTSYYYLGKNFAVNRVNVPSGHYIGKCSDDYTHFSWSTTFTLDFKKAVDLHVDTEGNAFVVGVCTTWAEDRSTTGLLDICIFKFNPDGEVLSHEQFIYTDHAIQVKSVTLNADKNVMIFTGLVTSVSTKETTQPTTVTILWDMLACELLKEEDRVSTIGASSFKSVVLFRVVIQVVLSKHLALPSFKTITSLVLVNELILNSTFV